MLQSKIERYVLLRWARSGHFASISQYTIPICKLMDGTANASHCICTNPPKTVDKIDFDGTGDMFAAKADKPAAAKAATPARMPSPIAA
jgi:monoamine oxidase